MKKFLLLSACLLMAWFAKADYPSMAFVSGNDVKVLDASGLVITFDDGKLVASNAKGYTLFPLDSVTSFKFSDSVADGMEFEGVYTPAGNLGGGNEENPGGNTGGEDTPSSVSAFFADGSVNVFTASGIFCGEYSDVESARNLLGRGLYILHSAEGKAVKVIF